MNGLIETFHAVVCAHNQHLQTGAGAQIAIDASSDSVHHQLTCRTFIHV